MRIAVLVACYNRADITVPNLVALDQVMRDAGVDHTIYLLDDASPDRTGDRVKAALPAVQVVQGSGSLFWNRGMCSAYRRARADGRFDGYVLFNDDASLAHDAAVQTVKLWTELQHEAPSTLVGAFRASDEERLTYSGYRRESPHRPLQLDLIAPQSVVQPCHTFNANFVIVPGRTFEELDGNDPFYWHGFGDIDLGYSILRRGERVLIAPGWIGICDDRPPPVPSVRNLFQRIADGLSGLNDPRQNAYLIWKHRMSSPVALLAIAGMLLKRLYVVVLNLPHVAVGTANARQ